MTEDTAVSSFRRSGVVLPVLTFHRVVDPDRNEIGLAPVPSARFRRYLRWISACGFTPISPCEWLSWLRTGEPQLIRPVLVTFDDAYAELERDALPALAKAGFPATVFIPTDAIGGTNQWDLVHGFTQIPVMGEKAIASWSRRGISFGSHSASHADLATLPPDALTAEFERSARRLREITGEAPDAVAYPYGTVDAAIAGEAARFFSLGFTMEPGLNTASSDVLRLRRVAVPPAASWLRFRMMLAFGIDPIASLCAFVRPRRWLRALLRSIRLGSPSL